MKLTAAPSLLVPHQMYREATRHRATEPSHPYSTYPLRGQERAINDTRSFHRGLPTTIADSSLSIVLLSNPDLC